MSTIAARIRTTVVALVATLTLAGCVFSPPQAPGTETTGQPAPPPSESSQPVETDDASESGAPVADGPYAYQTATTGEDAWSFEPTSVRVVDADSNGLTAAEGQQLVVLTIDAELLQGDEADFYYQFRVAAFDPATNDYYGLSSASSFYAEDDLFTVGRQPSFQDAQAIYQVPVDWPITTWYFLHHSTGEQWFIDMEPS